MKILELYKHLEENRDRFITEVFTNEDYVTVNPKLNIIDLGAYGGEYSFSCLPFAKHIWAIEADPTPYAVMVKRIRDFDLGGIISPFLLGISGKSGKRIFNAVGGGGSRLLEPNTKNDKAIEVDTLTLNEFVLRENIDKLDILKIDVESAEYEIFGASDFGNAASKITSIVGEPHGGEEQILALEKWGFKVKFYNNHTFTAIK